VSDAVTRRVRLYPRSDQQLAVGDVCSVQIGDGFIDLDGLRVATRGPTPAHSHGVRVIREGDRWFALPRVRPTRTKTKSTRAVGLDPGVARLITTSDNVVYPHPTATKRLYALLRLYDSQMHRRTPGSSRPGSSRYRESKRRYERTKQRILAAQVDHFHKIANEITGKDGARLIAIEKFVIGPKIKANERYYRAVLEARWDLFAMILRRKAKVRGCIVVDVPPYYTSQTCSNCGYRVKKALEERWHDCPNCRIRLDRDVNAARNIRQLGIDKLTKR